MKTQEVLPLVWGQLFLKPYLKVYVAFYMQNPGNLGYR